MLKKFRHPFIRKVLRKLARLTYSLLWYLLWPLYLFKLYRRGRKEPLYAQFIGERFGFYTDKAPFAGKYIWVHAVSLGEMRAAFVLIQALRVHMPDMKLLLTASTATGRAQGQDYLNDDDILCWLPIDMPGAVKRFLRHYKPLVGLLMETEIWPNLMHYAKKRKVPMMLMNARLSEKSLQGAWKGAVIMRPAYNALSGVFAQTHEDKRRLRLAGAHGVQIVGNLKYDMRPNTLLLADGQRFKEVLKRSVIMAASTRQGEEELLVNAWKKMQWTEAGEAEDGNERPLLLIVPRHPQRFNEVEQLVQSENLPMLRRSAIQDIGNLCQYDVDDLSLVDVVLGDSLGEMSLYYGMSDLVLLGGSFKAFGGQNLIEALACNSPVIMGEHTYNFSRPSAEAIAADVAFRVKDFDEALKRACKYLHDPERLKNMRLKTQGFVTQNQGAGMRMAQEIASLVKSKGNTE